jgi:hypothetical protein
VEWVKCPACREEWTKLNNCIYWKKGQGEAFFPGSTHLCIECSESLKSFDWIVMNWVSDEYDNWPAPKIEKKWIPSLPAFVNYKHTEVDREKVHLWKNLMVKLWLKNTTQDDPEYLLKTSPDGRITVFVSGKDDPIVRNNAVDAWFAIRNEL